MAMPAIDSDIYSAAPVSTERDGFGKLGRLLVLAAALASFGPATASTAQSGTKPAPSAATAALQACWSPTALASSRLEEQVRRYDRNAFRDPPVRKLAPFTPISAPMRGSIRRVRLPPGKKLIALTFDLCEQPYEIAGYQGPIVDYLRTHRIKATFFAGGKWMLTHSERTQQLMSDPLFEVGNHTWEHRNLRLLAGPSLIKEIESAQIAYEQVRGALAARQCTGADPARPAYQQAPPRLNLFRFPFGACTPQALAAVAQMGLYAIQWDVASGDPSPKATAGIMLKNVLSRARPGSIIVFHANGRGRHTDSAVPQIVAALKAKGYEFVTVSELMKAGEPVITPDCYDSKPGDTNHYDGFARHLEILYQRARKRYASKNATQTGVSAGRASVRPAIAASGGVEHPELVNPLVPLPPRRPIQH